MDSRLVGEDLSGLSDTVQATFRSKEWFVSKFCSGSGPCVEVRFDENTVSVRDTKYRDDPNNDLELEPTLTVPTLAWLMFLDEVVGRSPSGVNTAITTHYRQDGSVTLGGTADSVVLTYTPDEWTAFIAGVREGQFHPLLVSA